MPRRIFDFYQRKRVVNVNANIIASGLLAIALAKVPVDFAARWIGPERRLAITLAAGAIDMVVDVVIYYALHWLANHWRPWWRRPRADAPRRSFFREASLVQFERAILSPVYYLTAMGIMYALQASGRPYGESFVVGFVAGIVVTRTIHTIWGVRTGTFRDNAH